MGVRLPPPAPRTGGLGNDERKEAAMMAREIVERGTILRETVGSTVHGLHHGGQDDRDEMAVYVEPPEYLIGLRRAPQIGGGLHRFAHFVERTHPPGGPSRPGGPDPAAYTPRKDGPPPPQGHPTIPLPP